MPWLSAHEKLLTAFAGESLPDVSPIGNTWIPEFAALGALEPLDDEIAATPGFDQADFFPGVWDTGVIEGRAYRPQRSPGHEKLFPPTLRVRHGDKAPEDAYVAVRYRGRWFWVEDRDHQSKAMFTSVLFLFSLTETGAAQAAPVVTIPAR